MACLIGFTTEGAETAEEERVEVGHVWIMYENLARNAARISESDRAGMGAIAGMIRLCIPQCGSRAEEAGSQRVWAMLVCPVPRRPYSQ